MAVLRSRPAQVAALPRPVFTDTNRALATPARYASPGRPPNQFRAAPGCRGGRPGGTALILDPAAPRGGFDDVLDGTGTTAGGRWTRAATGLGRGPGTGRRGAQVWLRRRAA